MPFEVKWYVEGRVSIGHKWGESTLDELRDANQQLIDHIQQGTPPVHLLIDAREITKLPGTFIDMLKEIDAFRYQTKLGWIIMITNSTLMVYFSALTGNYLNTSCRAVESYGAVNALLRQVDPTLDHLPPDDWRFGMI